MPKIPLPMCRYLPGLATLGLCLGLSGCISSPFGTPYSEVPRATHFATSEQQRLQSAAHWKAIANDMTETLIEGFKTLPCGKTTAPCDRYYLREAKGTGAFAQALRSELITNLVGRGYHIARTPGNATEIDINMQLVKFSGFRPSGAFVSVGAISAGRYGLRGLWRSTESLGIATTVGLALTDVWQWLSSKYSSSPPSYEMIVTLSLNDPETYLARVSNIYYVNDEDSFLYQQGFGGSNDSAANASNGGNLPAQTMKMRAG